MTPHISETRKQLLQDNFFEFDSDDESPDRDFFESIDNSAEYHYIVSIYNWDDGVEVLRWIVESPLCDQGTAKKIFWNAQPSFYTRFLTIEEADYHTDVYELLRSIIENFEKGQYKQKEIYYDPGEDPAAEGIEEIESRAKWAIPDFMKEPSPGIKLKFD